MFTVIGYFQVITLELLQLTKLISSFTECRGNALLFFLKGCNILAHCHMQIGSKIPSQYQN